MVNSIIIDRCKLIGKGIYGTVFEGTWKGTWKDKKVAVKRIQIENVENNQGEEALQKLDHPNVVKLYHVESNSDFRIYALELCQLSLSQLFHGNKDQKNYQEKMPPEKEVCLQLAKGLAHIHEKGFIYWDFKPQNVLISVHDGKVSMKWADFGLSKPRNERGSYSTTEHNKRPDDWFAPEILIIKENLDRTTPLRQEGNVMSDIFSAGLIFGYYLLKGRHPYGSQFNIPTNIINNKPVNLTAIEEQQQPMWAIITDMLKNNPNERISSADVVKRIANI